MLSKTDKSKIRLIEDEHNFHILISESKFIVKNYAEDVYLNINK